MRVAMGVLLASLLLICLWLAALPAVAIHVSAQVVPVNGSLQITCRVPPDPRNRSLTAGLRFYSASTRELAGERSALIHTFPPLAHVPCPPTDDSYVAYCQVLRQDDSAVTALATVLVSGCE